MLASTSLFTHTHRHTHTALLGNLWPQANKNTTLPGRRGASPALPSDRVKLHSRENAQRFSSPMDAALRRATSRIAALPELLFWRILFELAPLSRRVLAARAEE